MANDVTIRWEGGQRFRARGRAGTELMLDGETELGASPMEALLAALGACMGIDVVDILQKGREDVTAAALSLSGERAERPPRRFTTVTLRIVLEGRGLSRQKAERAVELSRTTYCSVWNSMAPDIDLRTEIEVRESS